MGYSVYIAKGQDIYDISDYAGNINWSDNIDTLGMQFDFSTGVSLDRYFPKMSIDQGDIVILRNEKEIFRGIIVSKSYNGTQDISYTAYDFCFYLNKSKIIKQFNNINATSAIQQICSELDIKVGSIAPMRASITHIYYESTAAEIIDDILTQEAQETGNTYIKEMQGDSFYVFEKTSKPITATFKPAVNIAKFDIGLAISSPSRTLSIEDMKNSILIVSGDEQSVRVLAIAKDDEGIKKYGLLQEIESVDDSDLNKVQNVAENKLKELNKVSETISCTLLGSDDVRAGRVLTLVEESTGISGNYFVKSCSHTISKGIHTISVELEAIQ